MQFGTQIALPNGSRIAASIRCNTNYKDGLRQGEGGLCNNYRGAFWDPNFKTAVVCTKKYVVIGIS